MGNRLHVAKKYVVEYDSYARFNWQASELHDFLNAMDIEVCGGDGTTYPLDFEISKDDWRKGITRLKSYSDDTMPDDVSEALKALELTKEEMVEVMAAYLNAADPNHEFLEFSFF